MACLMIGFSLDSQVESIIGWNAYGAVLTDHDSSMKAEDAPKADESLSPSYKCRRGLFAEPQFRDLMASSLRLGESF
jgi:hypothetical protein